MANPTEEAIATLQNDALPAGTRETAVHYLQHHPSDEGTLALVVGLRDRDAGVRWACSTALAALGDQALAPLLRAVASTDNDPMLREGAHHALEHSTSAAVRDKTEALRAALKGPGAQLASMEEAAKVLYGA
jgi:HEAT repeat protein